MRPAEKQQNMTNALTYDSDDSSDPKVISGSVVKVELSQFLLKR